MKFLSCLAWGIVLAAACAASGQAQDFETNTQRTVAAPGNAQRAEASAALEAHDYAQALKLLGPLAAAAPRDALLLYDLGSAQDALDEASPAEASYRAAIAADPALLEAHVGLGLLLARAGRMEDARAELVAATRLSADNKPLKARAYRALARIDQTTRPTDASDELLAALKISPETPEDTLLTAELAQGGGGAGAAEEAYRHVLAAQPNDPQATAALAHLLLQSNRAAEAETLLLAAVSAHPGDAATTVQLAGIYGTQGKPDQALPLVEGLHKANPADADIARLLGGLLLETKDYAGAETLLGPLALQHPQDTGLVDDCARALLHLHRPAEAQGILAKIVAQPGLFPAPAALGDAAGDLAFAASQNNDPAGALRALEVRAKVFPPSAPVLFLTAISHDRLHHVKQAQQAYKQFLAASKGTNPDEEFQAEHRLVALQTMK